MCFPFIFSTCFSYDDNLVTDGPYSVGSVWFAPAVFRYIELQSSLRDFCVDKLFARGGYLRTDWFCLRRCVSGFCEVALLFVVRLT